MSFARSVIQSRQIAARVVARSSPATSTTAAPSPSRIQTSKFWTTAPVEQEETPLKKSPKWTTQKELVKAIAETHDLSLAESKRILTTVFDTIVGSLADKKPVRLANFGTFETFTSKAYLGRNPRTGDPVSVPEKERCTFRAHTALKKNISPPPKE